MKIEKTNSEILHTYLGLESLDVTLGNSLYGFNVEYNRQYIHKSKTQQGLVFFVRPQLNLSRDNISNNRLLYTMLGEDKVNMSTWVKHTLDPRSVPENGSPVINNKQAFIPIMTNTINTMTGFPDVTFPSTTFQPGLFNEAYSIIDGTAKIYNPVDISTSFFNVSGEPVMNLLHTWGLASTLMVEGSISPYADYVIENERCYDTRIFRLVLDQTGRFVTNVAATGPGFIDSVGIGSVFDLNRDQVYNESENEHNFKFKMMGVEYKDIILLDEFNTIGEIFNPLLEDGIRDDEMIKVSHVVKKYFNYLSYPRVNLETFELEYWVENAVSDKVINQLKKIQVDLIKVEEDQIITTGA